MDKNKSSPTNPSRPGFNVDPRFINLRPIGHGGNAVVYSATDSDCDKEVAIKKLSFCDKKSCKYALREIRLMRRLQHENIVTVYEVLGSNGYSLEKGGGVNYIINEISCVYIVQELLHADLHQLVQQKQLTEEHVKLFTYQLLRGLKYIHSANVLHRDLKPMNLLVNVEDLVLKIADFGLARVVDSDYSHKGFLTDNVGTCWYRSPELIISPRDYTKAIDMWSVGCILAEMISGKPLFPGAHEMDQIGLTLDTVCLSDNEWNKVTQILPPSFVRKHSRIPDKPLKDKFTNIDIDALDLLEKLLVFEPSLRITAEDTLAHPYLHQFSCMEDEPIVLRPFHIEHEVDELSPKSARRVISNEMCKSVDTCGADHPHSSDTVNMATPNSQQQQQTQHNSGDVYLEVSENLVNQMSIASHGSTNDNNNGNQDKNCANDEGQASNINSAKSVSGENHKDKNSETPKPKNSSVKVHPHSVSNKWSDDSGESIEPYSLDAGKEIIDLIPLHLIQVPTLEHQIKNLQIVVDIPDEENLKEQISPKENKDNGNEKSKMSKDKDNANAERLVVKVDDSKNKPATQKANDILNAERRAESPRENTDADKRERIDFIKVEKEKMSRPNGNINMEKFKNGKREKKKKKRRNNRSNSGEEGQDFDTLYRLPTEHLTRHRNSICSRPLSRNSVKTVEEQLRLHEELNERRKLSELEKETFIGAVGGGYHIDGEESSLHTRGRTPGGGNVSPLSEHSRDSSPSNEETNIQRRFER